MAATKEIRHVAMIMDGNRRWAQKRLINRLLGHREGAKRIVDVIDWCLELGIKELTLYTFSVQNFNRSKEEVAYLFTIFRDNLDKIIKHKNLSQKGIRIRTIGRLEMFPPDIQKGVRKLMKATEQHSNITVNFAFGYGGREEIVDACKKIAEEVKYNGVLPEHITEEYFAQHLYLNSDPDIMIRTGGEMRISNFLLWQNSYTELFFTPTLWPALTKEEFVKIINEFKGRERRFGT